jgi:uncharacterized protein YaaW (UPF0174 family)
MNKTILISSKNMNKLKTKIEQTLINSPISEDALFSLLNQAIDNISKNSVNNSFFPLKNSYTKIR